MRIVHADGLAGAAQARGVVVVIDVLRAFTVSAYALSRGARECRLVQTVDEALKLNAELPGSLISAEVDGLPIPGIEISNSPTLLLERDVEGRILIQRTSAGTQGVAAAAQADTIYAGSLVVARATAQAVLDHSPDLVTLVAMGQDLDHPEDRACARYLEALMLGLTLDLDLLLTELQRSPRYQLLRAGSVPGFPPGDLDLALAADRFDFAMPVRNGRLYRSLE